MRLHSLFKIADCAAFPSLYEPFGIVALEAVTARCPVVVTEVGGLQVAREEYEWERIARMTAGVYARIKAEAPVARR